MVSVATAELREIGRIAARLSRIVKGLEKFSFPLVAAPLAGLLTQPENHTATARIEALIHLAALACRGDGEPTLRQLQEWLNVAIYHDPITELEVPVEDVFVSNVDTWFGNVRLFEGALAEQRGIRADMRRDAAQGSRTTLGIENVRTQSRLCCA